MLGITLKSHITVEYLWELLQEYSVIDRSQLFKLLKQYTPFSRRQRATLLKRLNYMWGISEKTVGERIYLTKQITAPIESFERQIKCLYILMDYFEKVEEHYATGTYSVITMRIKEKDYDILYVDPNEEAYCLKHISKTHAEGFFVIVQGKGQIPLLVSEKIKAFAIVSPEGKIRYYSGEGG